MTDLCTYRNDDGIVLVTLDDGKANAVSHAVLDELDLALDRAGSESARAFVLAGRPGKFSARAFDLAAMTESTESMRTLVIRGARFMMRLYGLGMPTVAACSGHAVGSRCADAAQL